MAADPGAHVQAPYATLVPAPPLVWALPLDERAGFRVLTVVSFALAAALACLLRASPRLGLTGAAIVLVATSTANVRDPFLIDAFSYCFILGVLLALTRRRWWLVVPLLVVAVFARDAIVVLVAPALVVYAVRSRDARIPLLVAAAAAVGARLALTHTSLVLGFGPQATTTSLARRSTPCSTTSGAWDRCRRFPAVLAALVLVARERRLRFTLLLAACVAVANYAVQFTAGGATRYALELGTGAVEAAVLMVVLQGPWARRRSVRAPAHEPRVEQLS